MENDTTRIVAIEAALVKIPRWSDRINNAERPSFISSQAVKAKQHGHQPRARSTTGAMLKLSDKAT